MRQSKFVSIIMTKDISKEFDEFFIPSSLIRKVKREKGKPDVLDYVLPIMGEIGRLCIYGLLYSEYIKPLFD